MHESLTTLFPGTLAQLSGVVAIWDALWPYFLIFLGFSAVIFVHELGHFMAAKWAGVRVERFAIGFFTEVVGFTRGETRYSFNILPLGGYVKMLGQEDFDDKGNELCFKEDPRSFTNKPVLPRMIIVSAGVVMNILFAAFLFVIVFMVGVQENVTTVGHVLPESPAALAGLQPGDTILRINDRKIREYQEIRYAVLLADPHTALDFEIERRGRNLHLAVKPEPEHQKNLLQVGIMAATTHKVVVPADVRFDPDNPGHLQSLDVVVAIDGQPLEGDFKGGIEQLMRSSDGAPVTVTVERAEKDNPDGPKTTHDVVVFNEMIVDPSDPMEDVDTRNLLGLIPLVRVSLLAPKGRAALAGMKNGDVIVGFGSHRYPTQKQITRTVVDSTDELDPRRAASWRQKLFDRWTWNPERDIPVTVLRDGRELSMDLTPKARKGRTPLCGFRMHRVAGDVLRVAGTQEKVHGVLSPAAEVGIPAGAFILRVADRPVRSWGELMERFRQSAGSTVPLVYRTEDDKEVTCDFRVPHSLRTKLGLTTLSSIVSIDNQKTVAIEGPKRRVNIAASHSYGLYELLRQAVERNDGKPTTVNVRYVERPYGEEREAEVVLSADTIDPWLGRIKYAPDVFMELQLQTLKASGPIDALGIGVKKTSYFILQVYTMLQRMIFSRSVGVEHLSGPVGIVKIGSDVARVGFNRLLFFLAIISANLAVINFLPLPIVDGGLMVFLIIEKIKGSPVSLKIQVATQMIGLCLIVSVFLFVTFQDVVRLAG